MLGRDCTLAGPDADRSNVLPGGGNGRQAGPFGHGGRLLSPAGRKGQFGRPNRVLVLVVDSDDVGAFVRRFCCLSSWRDVRFIRISHSPACVPAPTVRRTLPGRFVMSAAILSRRVFL